MENSYNDLDPYYSDDETNSGSPHSSHNSSPSTNVSHAVSSNGYWVSNMADTDVDAAIQASLADFDQLPKSYNVTCHRAVIDYEQIQDIQSSDWIYLPESIVNQLLISDTELVVIRLHPLITIPDEHDPSFTYDLPIEGIPPVYCVFAGIHSQVELNPGTFDLVQQYSGVPTGISTEINCRIELLTTQLRPGSSCVIKPLTRAFVDIKDQSAFLYSSLGSRHRVLYPGLELTIYSSELDTCITLNVESVSSSATSISTRQTASPTETEQTQIVKITDCDLEVDFAVDPEWIALPSATTITSAVKATCTNTADTSQKTSVPAEPEPPKLSRDELRAQRLAYFTKKPE